jgi:hypothetical protein
MQKAITKCQLLAAGFFAVISPGLLFGDNPSVTIDWAAHVTGAQACPASVDRLTSISLTVSGINDVLYTYAVAESCIYLPSDAGNLPFGAVSPLAMISKSLNANPSDADCSAAIQAGQALVNIHALFPNRVESVSLADTLDAWSANKDKIDIVRATGPGCAGATQLYDTQGRLNGYASRIGSSHEKKFVFTLDKDQLCSLVLSEIDRSTQTPTKASLSWKCGVDDTLTLSLGTLLTTIDYRTYAHRKVVESGSAVDALVVDGRGPWTPVGLALLNYKLFNMDTGPHLGLTVSSGPAFKFGGTPQVGTFGWFAGASISLWRRFFITPGFHIGQFADFPAGFVPGQQIPNNFGELTPVTRWTTRFGVGLTYRTNSLIKSTSTTTSKSQTPTSTPKQ